MQSFSFNSLHVQITWKIDRIRADLSSNEPRLVLHPVVTFLRQTWVVFICLFIYFFPLSVSHPVPFSDECFIEQISGTWFCVEALSVLCESGIYMYKYIYILLIVSLPRSRRLLTTVSRFSVTDIHPAPYGTSGRIRIVTRCETCYRNVHLRL